LSDDACPLLGADSFSDIFFSRGEKTGPSV
jgi:hypothetical protein